MLRNIFKFWTRQTNKAQPVARLQRIGFIILGIEMAVLFALIGIGCTLISRCTPTISIPSGGICSGLLVLLLLVFRNPAERWPVATLAIGIILSFGCMFAVLVMMP